MPNTFVLFNGFDLNGLPNLWVTDGTSAGTSELAVAGASSGGLNPQDFTVFGSEVLFEGVDASGQHNLWETNGTAAGTSELSVAGASPSGLNPNYLTAFGSEVLFEGEDASGQYNLWVTDGTGAGTSEISVAGASSGGLSPTYMTVFGTEVLFAGADTSGHNGLWVTDGTSAGTSELPVAGALGAGLHPQGFTVLGSEVLFEGTNAIGHNGLWVTNGTAAGTSELSVAGAYTSGLNPKNLAVFGSEVLFDGADAIGQNSLWVTNGTAAGTSELAVAGASSSGLDPFGFTALGSEVLFEGKDASGNDNLWITNGTAAGTSELSIGAPGFNLYLTTFGSEVLFQGNYNLWATDGTSAGTSELSVTGASAHGLDPSYLTSVTFPASASTSTLTATPGSVTADGSSTTTLTVTVEDAHGNAIAGTAVTLSGSGSDNTFGTISGVTNAQGVFTTTLASTLAQSETITASEGGVQEHALVLFSSTIIQTDGSTSLTEVANQFFYLDDSSGVGPELQLNGAPVVAGQFGSGWAPIGAAQTATGYDVAWKSASLGLYTYWTTDSSGNHLTDSAPMSGTSYALESLETVFNQDLNGDGVIGLTKTVIQIDGPTSLMEVANEFFLDNSSGVGPVLQLSGAPVVAGQFGAWAPIGAVQTAGGYDVAWENAGLGLYTYWTTDSSGNHLTDSAGMSGTSYALESLETVFQQDLNGDGVIGPTKTVIQTDGSTSLTAIANQFVLDDSSGSGPTLQLNGAPVVAGQFGSGWAPIGAVQTATGYDVAWKSASLGLYTYWTTDSSGNHLTDSAPMSGTSYALESLESTFQQDLNGDGVIGPTTIVAGATTEIPSAFSGDVMFAGSTGTLQLDNSTSFSGTVAGLAGQDTLDLRDINPAAVQTPTYSGSSSAGTLTVTDGTHTAHIALLGNYLASTFVTSSDAHGGTAIVDPLLSSSNQQTALTQPQHA